MRTKLYNLLKAVSQAQRLTSTGPEQVCPGSGSGHILEIQQESEPTFSLNCEYTALYNGANYTEIHSHNTSVLAHKYHLAEYE